VAGLAAVFAAAPCRQTKKLRCTAHKSKRSLPAPHYCDTRFGRSYSAGTAGGRLGQKEKKTLPELFAATYWRRVLGAFFWIQTKEIKKIV